MDYLTKGKYTSGVDWWSLRPPWLLCWPWMCCFSQPLDNTNPADLSWVINGCSWQLSRHVQASTLLNYLLFTASPTFLILLQGFYSSFPLLGISLWNPFSWGVFQWVQIHWGKYFPSSLLSVKLCHPSPFHTLSPALIHMFLQLNLLGSSMSTMGRKLWLRLSLWFMTSHDIVEGDVLQVKQRRWKLSIFLSASPPFLSIQCSYYTDLPLGPSSWSSLCNVSPFPHLHLWNPVHASVSPWNDNFSV